MKFFVCVLDGDFANKVTNAGIPEAVPYFMPVNLKMAFWCQELT